MFADWISSDNLRAWLAENISHDTHAVSRWRNWFLFLIWMISLSLLIWTEAATEKFFKV